MKKLLMLLVAFALFFAPHGVGYDQADAKGYKSGKKSFNSTTTPSKSDSNVNATTNKPADAANKTTSTAAPSKGGFMKGLLLGGLAGFLFGSLFSDLGTLGAIFGFLINLLAIVAIVVLIRKAFTYFKNQRKKQELNPWKR